MKKREEGKYKVFVSTLVIVGMMFCGVLPLGVLGAGNLPYYDIEQDSLGNYHKAFINDSTGNYEIYYTNDIGGQFPQDWNPPIKISNTTTESLLLDLGIYLPTDTMFIIWFESEELNATTPINYTYCTISRDYGANWTEPSICYTMIELKYAEFDPLIEEPNLPPVPENYASPYGYYIVQIKTPMIQEWRDGIEALGGVFCGYVPRNAFVIFMSDYVKDQVEQLPFIRWIGIFHPLYKISSDVANTAGIIELDVMLFSNFVDVNETILKLEQLGGRNITYFKALDNYFIRLFIDASKIYDIALIPEVEWIDWHTYPLPEMDNVRMFTGAEYIHTHPVSSFDGSGIVGEVKDNGLDEDHIEFGNYIGYKTLDGNPPPDAEHGTNSFGAVFSTGVNKARSRGMVPGADAVFCDWDVNRYESIWDLHDNWHGVFQSNAWSQGTPAGDPIYTGEYSEHSMIDDLCIWRWDTVTMVYAIGMQKIVGQPPEKVALDAAAKNVIAAGGITHLNNADRTDDWPDSYVNYGTADGRLKPDLVGPIDFVYTTSVGDNYIEDFAGTSAGTSVVAGAAGLVYDMYIGNHFGNNPKHRTPHASTVKALLIADAYQYDWSVPPAPDEIDRNHQGWGLVDVKEVYDTGKKHFIVDEYYPLKQFDKNIYDIWPKNTKHLKISLVWSDMYGQPYADPALVNDLNLKVIDPNNNVYYGNNGLHDSRWSSYGTGINHWSSINIFTDDLNNVENVFIETPTQGKWRIEVSADNIQGDGHRETSELDQDYALVVSYEPFYKEVTLYPGWNLISLPLIQSPRIDQPGGYNYRNSERLEDVLRSIGNNYDSLQYFDASDGDWKHWHIDKPDHLNDLKVLGHRMGFWINVIGISPPATITLKVYGWEFTSNQEIELWDGWNMVGYPSTVIQDRDTGLNNLDWQTDIDAIQYFDGQSKTWKFIVEDDDKFGIGVGYWMHYKDDVKGSPFKWVVKYII